VWLMCGADVGSLVSSHWRGLASTMWSEEAGVWSWHRVCWTVLHLKTGHGIC